MKVKISDVLSNFLFLKFIFPQHVKCTKGKEKIIFIVIKGRFSHTTQILPENIFAARFSGNLEMEWSNTVYAIFGAC